MSHVSESALPKVARASDVLDDEHDQLEALTASLLDAYHQGDWGAFRRHWDRFETKLRAHIEMEERRIFPRLDAVNRREAEALRTEHEALRQQVAAMALELESRSLSHEDLAKLVGHLHAHQIREELFLYPWIDAELDGRDLQPSGA